MGFMQQNNLFWFVKWAFSQSKSYIFKNQNKLFCCSDVSDVIKKFITQLNKLIVNGLNPKVTKSMKIVISFFLSLICR